MTWDFIREAAFFGATASQRIVSDRSGEPRTVPIDHRNDKSSKGQSSYELVSPNGRSVTALPSTAGSAVEPDAKKRAPERYYNLRYDRTPSKPWRIESGELVATIKGVPVRTTLDYSRWRLVVDLDGPQSDWRVLSIASPTPGVTVSQPRGTDGDESRARRIEVEVTTPPICPDMPRREPVTLVVKYQVDNQIKTQHIDIDYRCLIGDFSGRDNAEVFARLARGHFRDPLIEQLIRRASSLPVGTPEEEVGRLKEWLGFGRESLQHDPPILSRTEHGPPYVLSPTEIDRYGGDCKGWTILVSVYLARRGLQAAVAYLPGHVWVRAYHNGTTYNIDLISKKGPPTEEPLSIAWVSEEPLERETFLKYNFGRFSEKLQLPRGQSRDNINGKRKKTYGR